MARVRLASLVIFVVAACFGCAGGGSLGTGDVSLIGARIHGVVVDPRGHGIGGVTVTSVTKPPGGDGTFELSAVLGESAISDSDGNYDVMLQLEPTDGPSLTGELEFSKGSARGTITLDVPNTVSGKFLLNVIFDPETGVLQQTQFSAEPDTQDGSERPQPQPTPFSEMKQDLRF